MRFECSCDLQVQKGRRERAGEREREEKRERERRERERREREKRERKRRERERGERQVMVSQSEKKKTGHGVAFKVELG